MDQENDTRPDRSPYASETVQIYFKGEGPLRLPQQLFDQSPALSSRYGSGNNSDNPTKDYHIDDITYDAGHVLVHFLAVGTYQCLRPVGNTIEEKVTLEFITATHVYAAAQSLGLDFLRDLAKREIVRVGDMLSLASVAKVLEGLALLSGKIPGVLGYFEHRIFSFYESAAPETADAMLGMLKAPDSLCEVLLKSIILVKHGELLRKAGLTPRPASEVEKSMKEAEQQAFCKSELDLAVAAELAALEIAAAEAAALEIAAAEAEAEAAAILEVKLMEEQEIASLLAKRERRGKMGKKNTERLTYLKKSVAERDSALVVLKKREEIDETDINAAEAEPAPKKSIVFPVPANSSVKETARLDPWLAATLDTSVENATFTNNFESICDKWMIPSAGQACDDQSTSSGVPGQHTPDSDLHPILPEWSCGTHLNGEAWKSCPDCLNDVVMFQKFQAEHGNKEA
ncbi:hypothetical protein FZEAL_94 [Fusarium zealandicum]|uniref:BTB domain-containing protein n=1 Tax=Fusarium zealandicum TaxID=1053134 RepID=A0A8H4UVW2_9HYPO|nr:hypothetical protein FZEAL_94 [Fusarium zealandicum]